MVLNRISAHCRPTPGYSLIELIVVLAGISLLTSLASTRFNNFFQGMETDETMAHLNAVSSECLRELANQSNTAAKIEARPDTALLEKNGYEIDATHKNCHYLQINPKASNSENHFKMGFGIFNGNVTKYGIAKCSSEECKDPPDPPKSASDCVRWAGDNCIKTNQPETKGFNIFFDYMESVRAARITCEISFKGLINPSIERQELDRWDPQGDSKCLTEKPVRNSNLKYQTSNCRANVCTKKAYIKSGKFVGYTESDYNTAASEACSISISVYLTGLSSDHAPESKSDLTDCGGKTYYFCEKSYTDNLNNFNNCKMNLSIKKCEIELEAERIKPEAQGNNFTTTEQGLPPCGTRCIRDNTIYDSPCPPVPE